MLRALAVMTLLVIPAAQAQTDTESLSSICSSLLAAKAGGVSGSQEKLCKCLITQTPAQLTPDEMLAYAEAAQKNQAPPDSVLKKVMSIATQCLQAAQ